MAVIPSVGNVSEAVARIIIHVAMKPYKTDKDVLVHPNDKQDKEKITECVSCANCDKTYVDETGRKFGVWLHEHRTKVESQSKRLSREVNVHPA